MTKTDTSKTKELNEKEIAGILAYLRGAILPKKIDFVEDIYYRFVSGNAKKISISQVEELQIVALKIKDEQVKNSVVLEISRLDDIAYVPPKKEGIDFVLRPFFELGGELLKMYPNNTWLQGVFANTCRRVTKNCEGVRKPPSRKMLSAIYKIISSVKKQEIKVVLETKYNWLCDLVDDIESKSNEYRDKNMEAQASANVNNKTPNK